MATDWIHSLNQGAREIPLGDGQVEVLGWAYSPHLADNVPHRHSHFEICQVGAYGHGRFLVEGRPYDIEPGDLFIARPGIIHQITNSSEPHMELYWVAFVWTPAGESPTGELDTLLHRFAESPVLVVPDRDGALALLWQALAAVAGAGPRPGYRTQLEALAASLLLGIAQAGAGAWAPSAQEPASLDPGTTKTRLAVRYIHDNLDRRLPVAEIAAHVHLSPRQLSRLFARHMRSSPAAYVDAARLDLARARLLHSRKAIKGIAVEVGYESVHHFSRAFSRRYGRSPGSMRGAAADVPKRQNRGATRQRRAGPALLH